MNDEKIVLENEKTSPCQTCDPTEEKNAPQTDENYASQETALCYGEDEADAGILTDTGTNSDSNCESSDSAAPTNELDELRGELTRLRQELAERDARLLKNEQIERTYAEFCDLYPNIPIASLPKEVWKNVENGTSLAAAYALAERKRAISLQKAADANANNRARSAGAVHNAQSVEYSPAEVRAMSSSEVREKLPQIMRSMQKWH